MTTAPTGTRRFMLERPLVRVGLAVVTVLAVFALRMLLMPRTGPMVPLLLCAAIFVVSVIALSARATRYRRLIDLAPEACFVASLEGRLILVNDEACRLLGYTREELLAMNIRDTVPAEDAARFAAQKHALATPGANNISQLRRKDGSLVMVEIVASVVGDHWQAFVRDITERKQVEDERKLFESLVESSSDFIGLATPQGTPIYINPAGRQLIGMPADYPIEQTSIADYYTPDQRGLAESVIVRAMVEQGRWSGETTFRHWQTGAAIPVSDEHFMIYDASGARVIGMGTVTRDISETKRIARERDELLEREQQARLVTEAAYAQRRASEERLRMAIEQAPIGMALVGLDGRFRQVNRALCEIVAYSSDAMMQLRFQDITHPADVARDVEQANRLARGEISEYRLEKRYLRRDGSSVVVNLSVSLLRGLEGEPPMYIAEVEDITDRKRSEAALRLLAQAGAILTASLDLDDIMTRITQLIVRDVADWCIVEVVASQAPLVRIAGPPEREALAHQLEEAGTYSVLRGPVIERVWETGQPVLLERVTADELSSYARSSEHLALLREIAPRSVLGVPLTSRGQCLGVLVWISSNPHRTYDQSDVRLATTLAGRASLAIENTRLYQSSVEANQLRDQVLGVVAHDLRNPLSVIRLAADALQPPPEKTDQRNPKPVQTILRSADRMSRLIQDLLDVSQLEAGQLGIERMPMSATEFVSEAVDSLRSLASSASIALTLEAERDLPDIAGDHHRLSQVLENLIGNAIKFTPEGGRIAVGARPHADAVLYYVADTGRGIAAENVPHVFDRFWQAQKGGHGAGLGLPIARGLVEAMGGRIWVESAPGLGTTFFFTIPTAVTAATRSRAPRDEHPLI